MRRPVHVRFIAPIKRLFKTSSHSRGARTQRLACGEQGRAAIRGADRGENGEAEMADIEMAACDAAEPADAESCFARGMNYSAGAGVAIDLIEAHKWFNIAAMCGHGDATRLRREIAEQMSDAEIGSAQRAARDWLKSHPRPQQAAPAIRVAA
jgi:uncharacterized protein